MSDRVGNIALIVTLVAGLASAAWIMSSNNGLFDVVFSEHRLLYGAGVIVFGVAALIAMNATAGVVRALGRLLLMACVWMGIILWFSRGAPTGLGVAFSTVDDIDAQFAEVAAALEQEAGIETAAADAIAELTDAGAVLIGRRCDMDTVGGVEDRWYVTPSAGGEVTHLTIRHRSPGRMTLTRSIVTQVDASTLPFHAPCT